MTKEDLMSKDRITDIEAMLNSGELDPVDYYRDLVSFQMRGGYLAEDKLVKGEDPEEILNHLEVNGQMINIVGNFLRKKLSS